jgi:hypothetical protein
LATKAQTTSHDMSRILIVGKGPAGTTVAAGPRRWLQPGEARVTAAAQSLDVVENVRDGLTAVSAAQRR